MYKEYWGLKENPFQNTSDPRYLCLSEQHEEALTRLQYAVQSYHACAMLTGVFGSGKTLLVQALMDRLPREKYTTAFIFNPQFDNVELLREIVYQLGVHDPPSLKSEILHRMADMVQDDYAEGRHTVIVLDEAHLIEERMIFEELRLLLNFQKRDKFLLTLLLVGQPELRDKINHLKQFDQRISLRYHLKGLKKEEVKTYIDFRMKVAGAARPVFQDSVYALIYDSTGGIPRRVNQICDLALLAGFGMKKESVDEAVLREVTADAQLP